MDSLPMAWLVLAFCIVSAAVVLLTSRRRQTAEADLGAVSNNWIAEYRLGRGDDGSAR
jgi:hypothetical protein